LTELPLQSHAHTFSSAPRMENAVTEDDAGNASARPPCVPGFGGKPGSLLRRALCWR
jgi:hypothetical protein